MILDKSALNRAIFAIETHPTSFDMADFIDLHDRHRQEYITGAALNLAAFNALNSPMPCGTTACLAGWIVVSNLTANDMTDDLSWDRAAMTLLGFPLAYSPLGISEEESSINKQIRSLTDELFYTIDSNSKDASWGIERLIILRDNYDKAGLDGVIGLLKRHERLYREEDEVEADDI